MFAVSDVKCRVFLLKLIDTRKSYIIYIFREKERLRKTEAKALVRHPREMFYEVRIEETLSLNAFCVILDNT